MFFIKPDELLPGNLNHFIENFNINLPIDGLQLATNSQVNQNISID